MWPGVFYQACEMNNSIFAAKPILLPLREQLHDRWRFLFYVALLSLIVTIYFLLGGKTDSKGILIGGFIGLFAHWQVTCVSLLNVNNKRFVESDVERWLLNKGYIHSENPGEYIPRLHRLLRFNSQNVRIQYDNTVAQIYGPLFLVKKISRFLAGK